MPKRDVATNWDSIPMSSEARALYESEFLPQFNKLMSQIRNTPLSILVWGPGSHGGDLYEKRLQIRGRLRTLGHAAIFSEELSSEALNRSGISASTKVVEFCQAVSADFIVVIHSSAGSIAEVHDFAEFLSVIGRKMLVFIDHRYHEGYSYSGALEELSTLYNNVETYRYPIDIKKCFLLSAVEKKVLVLQAAKWRASLR